MDSLFVDMSPVEEIKSRIDPVELVGQYVKLTRAGINWKALCPFHQEKTASFFVSPARGTWRCFGCSKGGDIFTFVMEREGLSFRDALEMLARRAGVELRAERPEIRKEREELFSILETATKFYEDELYSKEGERARNYLASRGLKPNTAKEFRLGYAPNEWDALLKHLIGYGYAAEAIEKAGLAIRREAVSGQRSAVSGFYDRFRGRIMFPIADLVGRVVGFSGRILPEFESESSGGKYVNSPETELFRKSRILYGLDKTKSEIQRSRWALVVEGQMDLLMSWQERIRNAAATSGTALTPMHLAVLKRYAPKIVFAFDQDRAGVAATERAITLASRAGFDLRVAVLEEKDPAELARTTPAKLQDAVEKAPPAMVYYMERAWREFDAGSREGKVALTRWILPKIKVVANLIERAHWLEELSSRLRVPTSALSGELAKIPQEDAGQELDAAEIPAATQDAQPSHVSISPPQTRAEHLAERALALCLAAPESSRGLLNSLGASAPAPWQSLLLIIAERAEGALTPQEVSNELAPYLESALLRKEWEAGLGLLQDPRAELELTLRELQQELLKERARNLVFAIKEAEGKNQSEELERLMRELAALTAKFNTIKDNA